MAHIPLWLKTQLTAAAAALQKKEPPVPAGMEDHLLCLPTGFPTDSIERPGNAAWKFRDPVSLGLTLTNESSRGEGD